MKAKKKGLTIVAISVIAFVSILIGITVPTQDSEAWPHHECCSTVLVWKAISTWGSIKTGDYTVVYGYVEETRCDQGFWHWKVWPHGDPCPD